uniref:TatD DNase domain containing 3 n=1 Tax=Fundulus heteroclitus TaxID=8078 RepID=A0A3Q2PCU3_FUNHE
KVLMDYSFVDCHCHISATEFQQAMSLQVFINPPSCSLLLIFTFTFFSRSFPDLVAPCLGLHPLQAGGGSGRRSVKLQDLDAALPHFYSHRDRLVAIGEIGLDFTPWCAPTQQDRDDQMRVFVRQLEVAKDLRPASEDRLIQLIPLEHVCLETDSPALGPHRHERNEPANIALSCCYVAKVKGLSPETVRLVTTQNAYRLFSRARLEYQK